MGTMGPICLLAKKWHDQSHGLSMSSASPSRQISHIVGRSELRGLTDRAKTY